jgi:hypothetical protein
MKYLIVTVTTFWKYLIITVTISNKYLIVTVTMFKEHLIVTFSKNVLEYAPFCFVVRSGYPESWSVSLCVKINLTWNPISTAESTPVKYVNINLSGKYVISCIKRPIMWIIIEESQPCYSSYVIAYGTKMFHVQIVN